MFKISIVLCVFLALNTSPAFSQKLDSIQEKKVISLDLRDKPLNLVVEEIYKQTGCKVVFDEKWNDLPLSGQYTGVTLEDFFWRSLGKYNVSLSYLDKSNVANLRFFADGNIGKINTDNSVDGDAANGKVSGDISVLHEEQRQELQTYLEDPESVDPVSGMKLGDIRELQSSQQDELEQLRNDPETIDPLSGMKNAEINKLHNEQNAELEQLRNDPETIDPLSGMTNAEINKLQNKQNAELEQLLKNRN